MFDLIIMAAQKDFNKLGYVYQSIRENIGGYGTIYCITDVPVKNKFLGINYVLDEEVIDFDFSKIKEKSRHGWYRQQFIKLFQDITWDDYLVIDGDVWINKKMDINQQYPIFYHGIDQNHPPYFKLMKTVAGLDRVYPYSFICEMMLFKRNLITHMLGELNIGKIEFFNRCVEEINKNNHPSGFSEYEFYGNYIVKNWPDLYTHKSINVMHQAKKRPWENGEIEQQIKVYKDLNYDLITMHSWM